MQRVITIPQTSLTGRLLAGSGWMLGARVLSGLAGLGVCAMLSRMLRPSEMGAYFLAVSVAGLGGMGASLGTKDAAVRLIAERLGRQPGEAHAAIRLALKAGIAATALSTGAYFAGAHLLVRKDGAHSILVLSGGLMALWIAVSGLQSLAADIFRGLGEFRVSACFSGAPGLAAGTSLLIMLTAFRLLNLPGRFSTVLILSISSGAAAVLGAGVALAMKLFRLKSAASSGRPAMLLGAAWPMLLSNVLLYVISQADLWFVGSFRPSHEVALYGAAWRLAQTVSLPLAITNAVLPPMIAELHAHGNKAEFEGLLRQASTWGAFPALAACILALAAGGHILAAVYGTFYSSARLALALLSLGHAGNVISGSSGFALLMTGNERTLMAITAIVAALFTLCEWLTVPHFGIGGAAAVAAAAMLLQNLLMTLSVKKKFGIWTTAYMFRLRPAARPLLQLSAR